MFTLRTLHPLSLLQTWRISGRQLTAVVDWSPECIDACPGPAHAIDAGRENGGSRQNGHQAGKNNCICHSRLPETPTLIENKLYSACFFFRNKNFNPPAFLPAVNWTHWRKGKWKKKCRRIKTTEWKCYTIESWALIFRTLKKWYPSIGRKMLVWMPCSGVSHTDGVQVGYILGKKSRTFCVQLRVEDCPTWTPQ